MGFSSFFFFFLLTHTLILVLGSDASQRVRIVGGGANEDWEKWLRHISKTTFESDMNLSDNSIGLGSSVEDEQYSQLQSDVDGSYTMKHGKGQLFTWRKVIVSKDGSGDYHSIQAALDSVQPSSSSNTTQIRTLIYIKPGLYREKIMISRKKPHITLMGEEGKTTTIVWNDTASTLGPDGIPRRTIHSATAGISARFFVAKNIIFQNDAPPPFMGQIGGQAVALRISGDKAAFFNCGFLGHQDTLYDHRGRHYFYNCTIQGSIDFIFGSGRSLYRRCHIRAIRIGDQMVGSVTAQKRNETYHMDSGFSFVGCNVSGEGWVYLGRAWGPNSRVVFSYTWMDNIIAPGGWNDWGITSRQSGVYYGQFKCWGPGSNIPTRVLWARQLSFKEAKPFLGVWFINGKSWL